MKTWSNNQKSFWCLSYHELIMCQLTMNVSFLLCCWIFFFLGEKLLIFWFTWRLSPNGCTLNLQRLTISFSFLFPGSADSFKRFCSEKPHFQIVELNYLYSGVLIKIFNSNFAGVLISQNRYFHRWTLVIWPGQGPECSLLWKTLII